MPSFNIVNRSPDNSTFFSQLGMANWAFLPIVEMVERGLTVVNGTYYVATDYLTLQVAGGVPGFPQLFFRLHGHFNFVNLITSGGSGKHVAAGSIVNSVEVIDQNGTVFSRMDGLSFAIPSSKTTTSIEPINLFANSFRELELLGSNANVPAFLSGNDSVSGHSGTELLQGFAGNDGVAGRGGADELFGDDRPADAFSPAFMSGHDTLWGEGGTDTLWGGLGNDTLFGGTDADTLSGDDGDDLISGWTPGDLIYGGQGTDTWHITGYIVPNLSIAPTINLTGVAFSSIEVLRITGGQIVMNADQLVNSGVFRIEAGQVGARDELTINVLNGQATDFTQLDFVGWNNDSGYWDLFTINGSAANDSIVGSRVSDRMWLGEGQNTAYGGQGYDMLSGGDQADTFYGGAWGDTLNGWGGNDLLIGDDPGNRLDDGDDALNGFWGDDSLVAYQGFNTINGGDGVDTVNYRWVPYVQNGEPTFLTVNLATAVDPNDPNSYFSAYGDIDYGEVSIPYLRDFLLGIENVLGSDSTDRISGNNQNNVFRSYDGDDTLSGGDGNDLLDGGRGSDSLIGGNGDDRMEGGASADSMDGGAGEDWLVTGRSIEGFTIRLWNGTSSGGFMTGDSFINIEHAGGSRFTDILIGSDPQANSLLGFGGADYLDGLGGADWLDGGTDVDTVGYTGSTTGVRVRLWNGTGELGTAQGDRLFGIENLIGSDFADTLLGANDIANLLTGRLGNDFLSGLTGNDRLDGSEGNDTLDGGGGADVMVFSQHHGQDRVLAFENGIDRVDLTGTLTFASLTETAITGGVRLVVTAAPSVWIDLMGVTTAQIDAGDFI